jgi:hypothetical protein
MPDDLPDPNQLDGAQAFDCLRRLRVASAELRTLLRDQPDLAAKVERILQEAWRGTGQFRDL